MRILVINCGSSSLKYRFFEMRDETLLARGLVERIGSPGSSLEHRPAEGESHRIERPIPNHEVAVRLVIEALGTIGSGRTAPAAEDPGWREDSVRTRLTIDAVGHRVVQGAEVFPGPAILTPETIASIEALAELAPLHNKAAAVGMRACASVLPEVPGVAVFDTSFHQTLPPHAYLYAIPYTLYQRYKIRRYGFHGTSHKYVAGEAARLLGRPLQELKLITCHLGNGSSLCAIAGGRSVDTSMGFTPLAGVVMGTRCGDIDPAIVPYLMEKERLTSEEVVALLNKECGVYGISGLSHDFRDLEWAASHGDERAEEALQAFTYSVRKFLGAYAVAMDGLDALVFTGGLGENSDVVRSRICKDMGWLGVSISPQLNAEKAWPADISTPEARTRTLVIPTNEELMIARETQALLAASGE